MSRFWVGFIVGGLFQASVGTVIGMNIARAWPASAQVLTGLFGVTQ